ncbi:MAG TPA: polysaccharide deacetylase family protein [Mycobacteriales bacterium]|nr:polysaccharide deacetylase family protein [Mycobacteriales bacterium]
MTAAAAAQLVPAATWLPPFRRLWPGLGSPMPVGSVAVTFDDGPHPDGTLATLDALDALGWRATFFMLGAAVRRYPEVAREVALRGHGIALHGDEHRYLLLRTPGDTFADLQRCAETVADITGVRASWWRPPYGVLSGAGLVAAHRLGLRPVLWSAWGEDWKPRATPEHVAWTVFESRMSGGTILLHDSDQHSAPEAWRTTVAALPLLATELERRRLTVRPLPDRAPCPD